MTNVTHKFLSMYLFFIYNSLHVSSTWCSSSGETSCINTTSGNCHSVLVAVSCAGWEFTPRWSFTKKGENCLFFFSKLHKILRDTFLRFNVLVCPSEKAHTPPIFTFNHNRSLIIPNLYHHSTPWPIQLFRHIPWNEKSRQITQESKWSL
jgi:hypothetical protein